MFLFYPPKKEHSWTKVFPGEDYRTRFFFNLGQRSGRPNSPIFSMDRGHPKLLARHKKYLEKGPEVPEGFWTMIILKKSKCFKCFCKACGNGKGWLEKGILTWSCPTCIRTYIRVIYHCPQVLEKCYDPIVEVLCTEWPTWILMLAKSWSIQCTIQVMAFHCLTPRWCGGSLHATALGFNSWLADVRRFSCIQIRKLFSLALLRMQRWIWLN